MKKQKMIAPKEGRKQTVPRQANQGGTGIHQANSPIPRTGILMHIDELRQRLKRIQTQFGVDPGLLPDMVQG